MEETVIVYPQIGIREIITEEVLDAHTKASSIDKKEGTSQ